MYERPNFTVRAYWFLRRDLNNENEKAFVYLDEFSLGSDFSNDSDVIRSKSFCIATTIQRFRI